MQIFISLTATTFDKCQEHMVEFHECIDKQKEKGTLFSQQPFLKRKNDTIFYQPSLKKLNKKIRSFLSTIIKERSNFLLAVFKNQSSVNHHLKRAQLSTNHH